MRIVSSLTSMPLNSFYIDTDIIIRFLTGDDLKKQEAAAGLFQEVERGKLTLFAPVTVFADAVYVLASPKLYNLPRQNICDLLLALLELINLKVDHKQALKTALNLYVSSNLDFGDAFLAALALRTGSKNVFSYDHDFDKVSHLKRIEP
ncbi:MAG: PIN domain-containing protein [bacterium]|nr:PIN domain-containing protein [bacterium]